jgi:hypothetical protein
MSTIDSAFMQEFMGPTCLYTVLARRMQDNPLLLRRNIYRSVRPQVHSRSFFIDFHIPVLPPCGLLTFHVVYKSSKTMQYQVLYESCYTIKENSDPLFGLQFPVTDAIASNNCQDIFLLVLLSTSGQSKDAHERWMGSICKTVSESASPAVRSEILEIQLPCYATIVDLHELHLARAKGSSRLSSQGMRSFMFPAGNANCNKPSSAPLVMQKGNLSTSLQCKVFLSKDSTSQPQLFACEFAVRVCMADDNLTLQTQICNGDHGNASELQLDESRNRKCKIGNQTSSQSPTAITIIQANGLEEHTSTLGHKRKLLTDHHIPACSGLVVYHFCSTSNKSSEATGGNIVQNTVWYEQRTSLRCVWCDAQFLHYSSPSQHPDRILPALHALAKHVHCFHSHFTYDMTIDAKGLVHVRVVRNKTLVSPSAHAAQQEASLSPRPTKGKNRLTKPVIARYHNRRRVLLELSAWPYGHDLNSDNGGKAEAAKSRQREMLAKLLRQSSSRPCYHVTTGQVMSKEDLDLYMTSAENIDAAHPELSLGGYDLIANAHLLDEYVDINVHEKEFMFLWNTHLHSFPAYSDALVGVCCERFVQRFADVIVAKRLRYNLLLHLLALWDFGLLLAEEVLQYVGVVDELQLQLNDAETSTRNNTSSALA